MSADTTASMRPREMTGIEMSVKSSSPYGAGLRRAILPILLIGLSGCAGPATILRVQAPTAPVQRRSPRHGVAAIPLNPPSKQDIVEPVVAPPADEAEAQLYEYAELNEMYPPAWFSEDIRNAASDLSYDTDITVQVGPLVVGSVSLESDGMPIGLVLDLITTAAGATYVRQAPNIYLIASINSKSPIFPEIAETELVDLWYVSVTELRDLLPGYLLEYVRLSTSEPHAMVTAPGKLKDAIVRVIRSVDQPQVQVVLRALVIELSEQAARELGFRWAAESARTPVPEGGSIPSNRLSAAGASQVFQDGAFTHAFDATPVGKFTHTLQAAVRSLVETGKASIRVDTSLMAQNGKPADLNFRLQQFFRIETGTIAFPRIDLEKIESGVKLEVTPQISAKGEVTLLLNTTVDDVVALGSNGLPVVQQRNTTTTVRVPDGDTIVIAGMVEERESQIEQSVPILGRIPVIGRLFSRTRTVVSKREVAIFITPQILPDSGSIREWEFAAAR